MKKKKPFKSKLVKQVMEKMARNQRSNEVHTVSFSPAVLDAMRLSDVYIDVKPQEHVLPLDALAGFFTQK